MNKKTFLAIGLFLLLIIPSLIIAALNYTQTYNHQTEISFLRRQELSRTMANLVQARLDLITSLNQSAASDIAEMVNKGEWSKAIAELKHLNQDFSYIEIVFLVDAQGILKGLNPPAPQLLGQSFTFRDWYKGVSKNWEPYASEVFKRAVTPPLNTVVVAVPIKNNDGKVLGAMGAAMSLDSFYNLVEEFQDKNTGLIYIVNQKGQIVAHPSFPPQGELVDFSSVPVVAKLLNGESGVEILYNTVEKQERLSAYQTIPKYGWGVVVAESTATAFADRDKTLKDITKTNGLLVLINVLLALGTLRILGKLKKSEQRYRLEKLKDDAILSGIGDAVFAIDVNKKIILFNKAASEITGFGEAEVLGKVYTDYLKFRDEKTKKEKNDFINLALGGKKNNMANHTSLVTKDGKETPVADSAAPVFSENGRVAGVVVVFRDVTHEHEIEKAKDEFISLASHQLRTPLTVIRLYSEMLKNHTAGKLNKKQNEYTEIVHNSTLRMIELVNSILNVSRIELGTLVVSPVPAQLEDLVQSVVNEIQISAKEQEIKINFIVPTKKLPAIAIDNLLLRQIIHNFITNAVRYSNNNSTVVVTIEGVKQGFRVTIKDSGIGIPKDAQKHIFQRFYRADNAIRKAGEGNGLGMYLSKLIAETAGCQIGFASEENKGSTFYVIIPKSGMQKRDGTKMLT
jgi:PAS domain S-box-containing protein